MTGKRTAFFIISCTSCRSSLVRCLTVLVLITPDRVTILIHIRDFPVPFHVTPAQLCHGIKGTRKPLANLGKSKQWLDCHDKTLPSCTCSGEDGTLGKVEFLHNKLELFSILFFATIALLWYHMYLSPSHRVLSVTELWSPAIRSVKICWCLLLPEGLNSQRSQRMLRHLRTLGYLSLYSQCDKQIL